MHISIERNFKEISFTKMSKYYEWNTKALSSRNTPNIHDDRFRMQTSHPRNV